MTLLEVLVVVAIIGILVTLLLPSLARAKGTAEGVFCRINESQIMKAHLMYAHDHGTFIQPESVVRTSTSGIPRVDWAVPLIPYTGSKWTDRLYRCPDFRRMAGVDTNGALIFLSGKYPGSYGLNVNGVANRGSAARLSGGLGLCGAAENSIRSPSLMIALADSFTCGLVNGTYHIQQGGGFLGVNHIIRQPNRLNHGVDLARGRHRGRLNVASPDGHVEAVAWDRLLTDWRAEGLRRWNRDNEPHAELLGK